jgi:hypothetical protein
LFHAWIEFMKNKSIGPVVLGATILIAVALFLEHRGRSTEMAHLQRQVEDLTASARTAEARGGDPNAGTQLREMLLEQARSAPPRDEPPTVEKVAEPKKALKESDVIAGFNAGFEQDREDSTFTERQKRELIGKFNDALPKGSVIRDLDCRESMCRLETSHLTDGSFRTFVHQAILDPETRAWTGPAAISLDADHPAADGSVVAVAFLAREGHALPRVE